VPPMALRWRVGAGHDPGEFVDSGRNTSEALQHALRDFGRGLDGFETVLDFGCGPGRVLRDLTEAQPGPAYYGCDIDPQAIRWASDHLPGVSFAVNRFHPPLPYEDHSFDLVFSVSIFSHLGLEDHRKWRSELARILRPGGLALITTNGDPALEEFTSGRAASNSRDFTRRLQQARSLHEDGVVFEPYERSCWNDADFSGVEGSYGMTFLSEAFVRDEWSDGFDVHAVLPGAINVAQDLVIAERSPSPALRG
jgi:SAM-dependent methyltransferase